MALLANFQYDLMTIQKLITVYWATVYVVILLPSAI